MWEERFTRFSQTSISSHNIQYLCLTTVESVFGIDHQKYGLEFRKFLQKVIWSTTCIEKNFRLLFPGILDFFPGVCSYVTRKSANSAWYDRGDSRDPLLRPSFLYWDLEREPTSVQVRWETIDKFPRSRLRQLRFASTEGKEQQIIRVLSHPSISDEILALCDSFSSSTREFYFDRSPRIFENILGLYRHSDEDDENHQNHRSWWLTILFQNQERRTSPDGERLPARFPRRARILGSFRSPHRSRLTFGICADKNLVVQYMRLFLQSRAVLTQCNALPGCCLSTIKTTRL